MTALSMPQPEVGTSLARREEGVLTLHETRPAGLLRPIAKPAEIIASQEETRQLVQETLKKGRDYGEIPGVDKPTLLKPGAERICAGFGVYPRFAIVEQEVDHDREVEWVKRRKVFEGRGQSRTFKGWEEERGTSLGLYRYVVRCELVHRESDTVIGDCIASCSTMESKYIDRPRDSENTALKMAEKRAHVGAVLLTFGLSEQFTQDVEDLPKETFAGTEPAEDAGVEPAPPCPVCQGPMYDNRDKNLERVAEGKKRMPDFKCKNKDCKDPKTGEQTIVWHLEKKVAETPATEVLTRESEITWGRRAGTKVKDLPYEALEWGVGEGRKLGERTAEWQALFRAEMELREQDQTPKVEIGRQPAAAGTTQERF